MAPTGHGLRQSPRATPLPAEAPRLELPPKVADHELLRLIGLGSYGQVWLARNLMGTLRAVKVVSRLAFEHDRPFDREFAGLQRYEPLSRSHEGLVHILQIGRTSDGNCFYYVMELADDANPVASSDAGAYRPKTLAGELRRRGHLPIEDCLDLAVSLASALGHLHKHRLVHRDLKPSNIIFVNGRPKIADIGLITESGDTRSQVGTEGFFPPQGAGLPQADLFALGKVLYEAITGLDRLHFPQIPPDWPSASGRETLMEFNEVVAKACETNPARRYQSAEEMRADLALLQAGKSVRRLHGLEWRLHLARSAGVAALALALVALVVYGGARRAADFERKTRVHIERAEAQARLQLATARLAQARATHHSGLAGQRFDCLSVLAEAARVKTTPELRNEAITALCLTDLRPVRRVRSLQFPSRAAMDPRGVAYVVSETNGLLAIHRAADDSVTRRLRVALPTGWSIVDLSPGGNYVSLSSPSGELTVLSTARGETVLNLPAGTGTLQDRFAPDGRHFLWCSSGEPWHLVDLETGRVKAEWPVAKHVASFQCRPNQPQVAVALAEEPVVELQELTTQKILRRWRLPAASGFLVWDDGGTRLAAGCWDHAVRVWDADSATTNFLTLTGHENFPVGLAFHPTEPWLVSSAWDGTTRWWDLRTGRQEILLQEWGANLRFTADGRRLCYCEGNDQDLIFFEIATETPCRILRGPSASPEPGVNDVNFDPSGRWLAAGFHDHLHLFDTRTARCASTAGTNQVFASQFSPDGRHLYWGGEAGLVHARLETSGDGGPSLVDFTPLAASNGVVHRILTATNFLAWNQDQTVFVQRDGVTVARLALAGEADSLALSPDGRWFAASERWEPNRVYLWDAATWRVVRRTAPPGRPDRAQLLFTPDSRFLILGGYEEYQFVRLTDGVIAHRLPRMRYLTGPAYSACSPDGTLLALAYSRTSAALYAYPSLRRLGLLETPKPADLGRIAFDPTGQHLAVAANGRQEVLLWDLACLRRQLGAIGLDW